MTLPEERILAIHETRKFLQALLDPKQTPRVPKAIRKKAYALVRHFPQQFDVVLNDRQKVSIGD
ncbi:BPSL0761 family protein [Microcystis sp. M061S2]|uniref:BPSL0761 family protein n=1 Tax=Microcystis sp. M061S2 TaxID=2771171 RepID=UPI00258C920F|nr:BPSL0761 family protein [Microcystis sp. M061S2]MCA2654527.1 hypothetical protein [Microcystis sp. M061S2]